MNYKEMILKILSKESLSLCSIDAELFIEYNTRKGDSFLRKTLKELIAEGKVKMVPKKYKGQGGTTKEYRLINNNIEKPLFKITQIKGVEFE